LYEFDCTSFDYQKNGLDAQNARQLLANHRLARLKTKRSGNLMKRMIVVILLALSVQ